MLTSIFWEKTVCLGYHGTLEIIVIGRIVKLLYRVFTKIILQKSVIRIIGGFNQNLLTKIIFPLALKIYDQYVTQCGKTQETVKKIELKKDL